MESLNKKKKCGDKIKQYRYTDLLSANVSGPKSSSNMASDGDAHKASTPTTTATTRADET